MVCEVKAFMGDPCWFEGHQVSLVGLYSGPALTKTKTGCNTGLQNPVSGPEVLQLVL